MQNGYLPAWITDASQVPKKVRLLFDGLTEEQLNCKPNAGQWSIGQLIDHIMVSNEQYFPALEKIAAGYHQNPFFARFKDIHTFFGNSLLKAVEPESKKKYQTVRKFRPGRSTYTLNILNEFEAHQQRLIDYARSTDHVDHSRTIISSPASSIIIYSLETALRIILSHEHRHINQALKLKEQQVIEVKS